MLAWRSGLLVIIISFLASVSWAQSPYKFADENKILMIDLNELKKSGNEKSYTAVNSYGLGNLRLGQSTTWTFWIQGLQDPNTTFAISAAVKSGSSDFTITSDGCSGYTLTQRQICYFSVVFAPSAKAYRQSTIVFGFYGTWVDGNGNTVGASGSGTYYLSGSGFDKPPSCEDKEGGSVIGVDSQSLKEVIPLVGTGFDLNYQSQFAPAYQSTRAKFITDPSFNREGWTIGIHHMYSPGQHRLFLGTGDVLSKQYKELADGRYFVVSPDGSEVYIFARNGRHLETLTSLMGAVKYSFTYDASGRLTHITDAYNNVTTIARNGSGYISTITSPYNQITDITVNAQGLITAVKNPNNETYLMTYKGTTTGLLATFQKPGGQITTLTYDSNGRLLKDLGHGGNFWEIIQGAGGALTKKSYMNRNTTYGTGYDANGKYAKNVTSSEGLITYSDEYENDTAVQWNSIQASDSVTTDDERFQNAYRRAASESLIINGVTSATQYAQAVTYPADTQAEPFNYSTLTKTSTTGTHTTTEVFNNSTKVKTITTPAGAKTVVNYNLKEKPSSIKVGNDTATTITYDTKGRLSTTIQGTYNKKTYAYNTAGLLHSVTNVLNEVTSYGYNLAGSGKFQDRCRVLVS